mmetsp:Transcript_107301/g.290716  ORF Transcript_107301/g.290716 Transcript_107301/m.290716 type:complete len:527 (+) Transcript_107301:153-1733(+)
MAPTLEKNLGLIFCRCEGSAFHSLPRGCLMSASYWSGFWNGYGIWSTKYFEGSAPPPSWNCTRGPLGLWPSAGPSGAGFSWPFLGLLGAMPAPVQEPQPASACEALSLSSSFLRASSSCSASKSSACVPSTKAVLTRSRCSLAASVSAFSTDSKSSTAADASGSASASALLFRFFAFAAFVPGPLGALSTAGSSAPAAAEPAAPSASGVSSALSHGLREASWPAAPGCGGALAPRPGLGSREGLDAPALPLAAASAVPLGNPDGGAAATPLMVSGPDTLHSTAASSCSSMASTSALAAASSSAVKVLACFPGASAASRPSCSAPRASPPRPPSSSLSSAASSFWPRPSSSSSTPCASFLACSRFCWIAFLMKFMPRSPVVGRSPSFSRPLSSLAVNFFALDSVCLATPRRFAPSSSESLSLRSTASESSDWSGSRPRMARRRACSSSCAFCACFVISCCAFLSPLANRFMVFAHFFLALRPLWRRICACFFSYSCFNVFASSGFSRSSLSSRTSFSLDSALRWMRR